MNVVWLWVAGSFVVGALVGAGIATLIRRGSDTEQRMRRLQREYDLYQADVARHFTQTGELLSRLRGAFEQLYGEVEDRATALVGEDALQRRLRDLEGGPGQEDADRTAAPTAVRDDRPVTPGFGGERAARAGAPDAPGPAEAGVPSADEGEEAETSVPEDDLRR